MKKRFKIVLGVSSVLLMFLAIIIGGNLFIEHKIKTLLEESLKKATFNYKDLNASMLSRSVSLNKAVYRDEEVIITAREVRIEGVDILEYLSNKNVEVTSLEIIKPEVTIFTDAISGKEEDSLEEGRSVKQQLLIKSLKIVDGSFKMTKENSLKEQFFSRITSLEMSGVSVDRKSLKTGLPFDYESLQLVSDSLFFNLNEEHDLFVEKIEMQGDSLNFGKLRIKPLYSKQEFQQQIPYEKDRFNLILNEFTFHSFNWNLKNDSLSLLSDKLVIEDSDIKIYRDKRIEDDTRRKPMYSKMIRELPFKLKLDTVKVRNLNVEYEELVSAKRGAGKVSFKNLDGSIYNITNMGMDANDFPETVIDVKTQFMGEANLTVNWNFDISSAVDAFAISGQLDNISSEGINKFLQPALNVKAQGGINNMRFNFAGDNKSATGDMKLIYNDFKVEVLREDGKEKNKLLSALANLIVNNKATSAEKEQRDIKTQRDQTRSFWNYLWKNIRNGALKSFI
ncbi:AsmA family protein [Salegentibacter maritimus]|uniref:hypothetical protein n=1 Tax=Salegentibacter maritimus TaxID=2794347 RepID=UPI0018E41DB0|nr:hypothetical protein [Salegentibacter maritimus]MBI6117136.1 hypothetical protein [Salegentibacter maritimus]